MAHVDEVFLDVAAEDEASITELYDRFAPDVYGMASQLLQSPELAIECTKAVFCEVASNAATFDLTMDSARSWVMALAHRRAVDELRCRDSSDRPESTDDDRPRPTVARARSVDDHPRRDDDRAGVKEALETLTPGQRAAVELAYFDGMTYDEVATLLCTSVETVRVDIREGLEHMADTLVGPSGRTVVSFRDELNPGSRSALRRTLTEAVRVEPDLVVVDLSLVTSIDFGSVAEFVRARNTMRMRGGALVLQSPSPSAVALLERLDLGNLVSDPRSGEAAGAGMVDPHPDRGEPNELDGAFPST